MATADIPRDERRVTAWIGQGVVIDGRISSAQDLRIEMFNALNRVNFNIPSVANLTIFNSATERNSTAGQITSTSTSARQIQLALRILF